MYKSLLENYYLKFYQKEQQKIKKKYFTIYLSNLTIIRRVLRLTPFFECEKIRTDLKK